MRIYATNLELGLDYLVSEVEVEREGEVVVEAERLAAMSARAWRMSWSWEAADTTCDIRGRTVTSNLRSGPKQYRRCRVWIGLRGSDNRARPIAVGIAQCLFATAKESSRYAINGVLWRPRARS